MARIALVYGTAEGQTGRIAAFLGESIRAYGSDVDIVDLKRSDLPRLEDYDGVIVGASIHMGKHEGYVADFVRRNRAVMDRLPSAFFSVSLAAHGDVDNAERYVEEFERETGWRPGRVAMFGGALLYTQYGFVKRRVLRKIAKDKGNLATDTSRDWVYTEWDGVSRFAEDLLRDVESRGTPSPPARRSDASASIDPLI